MRHGCCRQRWEGGLAGLALALLLAGCATPTPEPATTVEALSIANTQQVVLAPGDEIEIKFFYNPDLNEAQVIRPDGKITLQLIGDLSAAGKTPEELKYMVNELAGLFVEDPAASVFVRSLNNRRVFVGGSVKSPGAITMPGQITAVEAVLRAGGVNMRTANLKNVVVIRHKNGRRYGAALDLHSALTGVESTPFYLEPGDIVYVPNTRIVQVNQWIDQHINKLIPQFGVVYTYTSGPATLGIDTARDFTPVF